MMLSGGSFVWGVLGDKLGRKKALLGSILIYSLGACRKRVIEATFAHLTRRGQPDLCTVAMPR